MHLGPNKKHGDNTQNGIIPAEIDGKGTIYKGVGSKRTTVDRTESWGWQQLSCYHP